jgi:hypothetical protein
VTHPDTHRGALDAIDRILNRGGDADDVLRDVVRALHHRGGYAGVALRFVEGESLVDGPTAGELEGPVERVPVTYDGARVAEIDVAGASQEDRAFLDRVATLVSAHCLVGWDTGGAAWEP